MFQEIVIKLLLYHYAPDMLIVLFVKLGYWNHGYTMGHRVEMSFLRNKNSIFQKSTNPARADVTCLLLIGWHRCNEATLHQKWNHSYLVPRRCDVFHVTSCCGDADVTRDDYTATWFHATALPCGGYGFSSCNPTFTLQYIAEIYGRPTRSGNTEHLICKHTSDSAVVNYTN